MREALHVGEAVAPTVAPAVAVAINPAAGALVSIIVEAVTKAEADGGTGAAKKAQVLKALLPAGTAVVNSLLHARGINLAVDDAPLTTAVDNLVDGVVALLNALEPGTASQSSPSTATATPKAT